MRKELGNVASLPLTREEDARLDAERQSVALTCVKVPIEAKGRY